MEWLGHCEGITRGQDFEFLGFGIDLGRVAIRMPSVFLHVHLSAQRHEGLAGQVQARYVRVSDSSEVLRFGDACGEDGVGAHHEDILGHLGISQHVAHLAADLQELAVDAEELGELVGVLGYEMVIRVGKGGQNAGVVAVVVGKPVIVHRVEDVLGVDNKIPGDFDICGQSDTLCINVGVAGLAAHDAGLGLVLVQHWTNEAIDAGKQGQRRGDGHLNSGQDVEEGARGFCLDMDVIQIRQLMI